MFASASVLAQEGEKAPEESNNMKVAAEKRVFIFLNPVQFTPKAKGEKDDLSGTLSRVIKTKGNSLEAVKLKTYSEMPDLAKSLAKHPEIESLDRTELIPIKNKTGLDGVIQLRYQYSGSDVELRMACVDLRNGQVFRNREITKPVGAELFGEIEKDLTDFAAALRRSYRVSIKVSSNPSDATVKLDGEVIGKTPLEHELQSGEHSLEISAQGYKPYKKKVIANEGDQLVVDAALYNPIAARELREDLGKWLDARILDVGYRYGNALGRGPGVTSAHFATLGYSTRYGSWEWGAELAGTGYVSNGRTVDTFAGAGAGQMSQDIHMVRIAAVAKRPIWEVFTVVGLSLGARAGLNRIWANDAGTEKVSYTPSGDVFMEGAMRIARSGNNSFELALDLGMSYFGQIKYQDRPFSLYGISPGTERSAALFGPTVGLKLRLVLWNDVF